MIDQKLIDTLNEIRQRFPGVAADTCQRSQFSIAADRLGAAEKGMGRVPVDRPVAAIRKPIPVTFACAIVGSSGHGKTSILAEMFPNLEKRGCYAPMSPTRPRRHWNSLCKRSVAGTWSSHSAPWELKQILRMVTAADAENKRTNVLRRCLPDRIEIDGSRGQVWCRGHEEVQVLAQAGASTFARGLRAESRTSRRQGFYPQPDGKGNVEAHAVRGLCCK